MNLQLLAPKGKKTADINVVSRKCNEANMVNLNKRITKCLYDMNFVVERIHVNIDESRNIVSQRFCYCLESTVQQFRYFYVDVENTSYKVESYDQYGNIKDITVRKTGIKNMPLSDVQIPAYCMEDDDGNRLNWERCRKLDEDIIIFEFSANGTRAAKAAEEVAGVISVNGCFVGEDEDGNKVVYETLEDLYASGNDVVGAYTGYFSSPSTLKHSVIFFVRLDVDVEQYSRVLLGTASDEDKKDVEDAREARFKEVDETTQGALSYGLKQLEKRRLFAKTGDKAVTTADYAKIFARPGLVCTTPVFPFGQMRNMFIVNTDILSEEEFTTEKARAIGDIMGIKNNFSDGAFVATLRQIRRSLEAIGIDDATDEQIISLGLQLRSGLLLLKGFARVYDSNMVYERAVVLLKLYAKCITVFCEQTKEFTSKGIAHKYTGEELLVMKKQDPAKFEFIIKNLDLMTSNNEAKLINWEGIEKPDAYAQLYLVNAQNASDSESSNQMLNKVIKFAEKETKQTMQIMAGMDAYKMCDISKIKPIRINKDGSGIGSMPSDAIVNLLGDEARKDASIMTKIYSSAVDSATGKIAKARIDTDSPYLVAVPDEYMLGSYFDKDGKYVPLNILSGARLERDYSPVDIQNSTDGKLIPCVEVYSARENIRIAAEINKLRKNSSYSDESLAKIENSLRIQAMLKYPTQGPDEYVFVYYVSNREIRDRINKAKEDSLINESRTKALLNFYFKNPLSCIVIAVDNTLKNQLAGFDFDGGAVITVPRALGTDLMTGKTVYGLYNVLSSNGGVLNDYTSILVKKFAANGYKYKCACIVYDKKKYTYEEKPVYRNIKAKNALVINDNEKIKEAQEKLGGSIFGYDAKSFLNKNVVENYVAIKDMLGIYHACNTIGDDIGMTIVLCSVPIMTSIEHEMFKEDGSFDYEVFQEIFDPLDPGVVNKKVNHKPYIRYSSVFSEIPDAYGVVSKATVENRFNRPVTLYRVTRSIVDKFCYQVSHLKKETTVEEWKILIEDFAYITRALGESSIDIKKDVTKTLGKVVFNIINAEVRCLGNIKKEHIDNNYQNVYKKSLEKRNEEFSFDFTGFTGDLDREINPKYLIYRDAIGDIKIGMAKIYAGALEKIRKELVKNSNYNYYKENYGKVDANGDVLADKYMNTDNANHKYISYCMKAAIPKNGIIKLSKYEKQLMLDGLFNLAILDGMNVVNDPTMLVKLAIEDAFMNYYYDFREDVPRFNFDIHYNSRLNSVINIYNELFIMERTGLKTIPVELELALDCEIDEKHEGHYLSFDHGVCEFDEDLLVKDDFTGSALCENGKLVVEYDPTLKLFKTNVITLSIDKFSLNKNSNPATVDFAASGDDIYEGNSYGFNIIEDKLSKLFFKEVSIIDQYGDCLNQLALEDEDGNVVVLFDQCVENSLDNLLGKELSGYMLVGYNYETEEKKKKGSRAKKVVRRYNYLLNGYVAF